MVARPSTAKTSSLDDIIIIDDFYTNPNAIRELALNKRYREPPKHKQLAKTARCNADEVGVMSELVEPYVKERDIAGVTVLFRYTLAGTEKKAYCHVDGCSYAGIVYLTQPEHCAGGTTLFRHKETGDEIFNPINKDKYNVRDESQWKVIKQVDMAFNRFVMYPGNRFHAITPVFFGDNIENARLTQNIFIYRPGDQALQSTD